MNLPSFKQRLGAREPLAGIWANLSSPAAVEILAATARLDWIGIDCEHVPCTVDKVLELLRAAQAGRADVVVRTSSHDPVQIAALLDIGVRSLLVPHVDTPAQAMQVVQSTRYPPQGVRGYASGTRACGYGRDRQYASRANELVCLVVMAETKTALGNIGAIARIEGVDAVYIGAADLAADMGFMGQPSHPEVKARIESAVRSIVAAGCVAGISVQNAALYAEYRELGATLFNIGQDVHIFANALDRQIETVLQAPPQSLSH